ncbi:MAG: glycosyltransferase family 39 protein [Planctomycetota bacterium]|nr:glycosyltransferase family 39 protein [Planctomycetota bacterium]
MPWGLLTRAASTPPPVRAGIVVAVCVLLFFVGMGRSGLSGSEGFRAIPAWEMLRSGDWSVTTLFGTPYLRKPPGIVWAIASSSAVLGETEVAARLPSAIAATLACLLVWGAGTRWFGPVPGVAAGLAMGVVPVVWMPARSAEIEALHNLLVLSAAVLIVDRLAFRDAVAWRGRALVAGGLALASAGMLLTKGPAGFPALAGLVVGACIAGRGVRPLRAWDAWAGLALGAGVFAWWTVAMRERMERLPVPPVLEDADFLWRAGKELDVALLVPAALAGALPWAIALPFALRRGTGSPADRAALSVSAGAIAGLACYAILGVDNPRYAMPSVVLVPLVYGAAIRRHAASRGAEHAWGRRLLLGRPLVPLGFMTLVGVFYCQWYEHWRQVRHSGRSAAVALADVLPDGASVVADELLDTRPEMLWYASREKEHRGGRLDIAWVPGLPPNAVPAHAYVLLRCDALPRLNRPPEMEVVAGRRDIQDRPVEHRGAVHKFEYELRGPVR